MTITAPIKTAPSQETLQALSSPPYSSEKSASTASPQSNYDTSSSSSDANPTVPKPSDGASRSSTIYATPSTNTTTSGLPGSDVMNSATSTSNSLRSSASRPTEATTSANTVVNPIASTQSYSNAATPASNITSDLDGSLSPVFSSLGVMILTPGLLPTGVLPATPSASTVPTYQSTSVPDSFSAQTYSSSSPTGTRTTSTLPANGSSEIIYPTIFSASPATKFAFQRNTYFAASVLSLLLTMYLF